MTVRHLLHIGNTNVPIARGPNPVLTLQDEMNRLFSNFFDNMLLPAWPSDRELAFAMSPAMDVVEHDNSYQATLEIPGIDSKDLDISYADSYMTIRGKKNQESKEEHKGYFRQERSYGTFQRVIALPDTANFEKAEAVFRNGVLTISIPKKVNTESKERRIEVKQVA